MRDHKSGAALVGIAVANYTYIVCSVVVDRPTPAWLSLLTPIIILATWRLRTTDRSRRE